MKDNELHIVQLYLIRLEELNTIVLLDFETLFISRCVE